MKKLLLLLLLIPNLVMAEEIALVCGGTADIIGWDKKPFQSDYKFEIFFDESKNNLNWRGTRFCSQEIDNTGTFSITKNLIKFECSGNEEAPSFRRKIKGSFALSRLSGEINWFKFMTSKDEKWWNENGSGKCEVAKLKF